MLTYLADRGSVATIGGEGIVVKPLQFAAKSRWRLIQPAVKCRGREYLRIIYGPEYTAPEPEQLQASRLGTRRSLALREFALASLSCAQAMVPNSAKPTTATSEKNL